MKSSASLPKLYELIAKGTGEIRIIIAHAIFSICQDKKMIDVALSETQSLAKKLPGTQYELIDIIYLLPDFHDKKIDEILANFYNDNKCYLIAYNAARALGHPAEDIVMKFHNR